MESRDSKHSIESMSNAFTLEYRNARGFSLSSASIMLWGLTEGSGRSRTAIGHKVSPSPTGP